MWNFDPMAFAHSCAGVNTSAGELAKFVEALAAGKLLAPDTVERMWSLAKLRDGKPCLMDASAGMGLGFIVETRNGYEAVAGSGGSSVAFRHSPADRLTIVVLTNCQGVHPDEMVHGVSACFVPELKAGDGR